MAPEPSKTRKRKAAVPDDEVAKAKKVKKAVADLPAKKRKAVEEAETPIPAPAKKSRAKKAAATKEAAAAASSDAAGSEEKPSILPKPKSSKAVAATAKKVKEVTEPKPKQTKAKKASKASAKKQVVEEDDDDVEMEEEPKEAPKEAPKEPFEDSEGFGEEPASDEELPAGEDGEGEAEEEDDDEDSEIDDQTAALIQGFHEDDEDMLEGLEEPEGYTDQEIPQIDKKLQKKAKKAADKASEDEKPGIVYIGRIPEGFFEHQMRSYFSQFGDINRLRLSRNPKTGKSRHWAFLEFKSHEVAEIVAKAMDNYLLFGHILKVKLVESVHEDLWKGANKRFKKVPWAKIRGRELEQPKSEEVWDAKVQREQVKRAEKAGKLKEIGYEFEAPALKSAKGVGQPTNALLADYEAEGKAIKAMEEDEVEGEASTAVAEPAKKRGRKAKKTVIDQVTVKTNGDEEVVTETVTETVIEPEVGGLQLPTQIPTQIPTMPAKKNRGRKAKAAVEQEKVIEQEVTVATNDTEEVVTEKIVETVTEAEVEASEAPAETSGKKKRGPRSKSKSKQTEDSTMTLAETTVEESAEVAVEEKPSTKPGKKGKKAKAKATITKEVEEAVEEPAAVEDAEEKPAKAKRARKAKVTTSYEEAETEAEEKPAKKAKKAKRVAAPAEEAEEGEAPVVEKKKRGRKAKTAE